MKFLRKLFLYWVLEFVFLFLGFFVIWLVFLLVFGGLNAIFSGVILTEFLTQLLEVLFAPFSNLSEWYGAYVFGYFLASAFLSAVYYIDGRLAFLLFLGLIGISYYYNPTIDGFLNPFALLFPHGVALMSSAMLTFSQLGNWFDRNRERIANGRWIRSKPTRVSQAPRWPVEVNVSQTTERNIARIDKLQQKYSKEAHKVQEAEHKIDYLNIEINNIESLYKTDGERKTRVSIACYDINKWEKRKKKSLDRMRKYENDIHNLSLNK